MDLLMVVFLKPISLHLYLLQLASKILYQFWVLFVFFLEDGDVLFLALPGIFSWFSIAFKLFVLGDGDFGLFELVIADIVVFLLYVLIWFHELCHLIPIKYFLLLLRLPWTLPLVFCIALWSLLLNVLLLLLLFCFHILFSYNGGVAKAI